MITSNKLNSDSPIAFFDSGIGGLTVLNKVKKVLPDESFIYYGDTVHMPYGEKTKEQLLEYSDNIFRFFEEKGCKAVVRLIVKILHVITKILRFLGNFVLTGCIL